KFFVWLENSFEIECVFRRTVSIEGGDALLRFVDTRPMPRVPPPEREIVAGESLEPLLALANELDVNGAINIIAECFDIFPDGHVHQDSIVVVIGTEVGRVSLRSLKPPHEAGAAICKGIDFIQAVHEAGHARIVKRSFDAADVDWG